MSNNESINRNLEDYRFSKEGYMLEFTIVYSEYNATEDITTRVVVEYQRYIDVERHISTIFTEGVHEINIGCRPSRMTRENMYDMLWERHQDMIDELREDDEDIIGFEGELYL